MDAVVVTSAQLKTELKKIRLSLRQFYVVVRLDVIAGVGKRSRDDVRFNVEILSNVGVELHVYRVSNVRHTALEVLVKLLWESLQQSSGDGVPPHIFQHARSTLVSPSGARFVCQNGTVRIVTD